MSTSEQSQESPLNLASQVESLLAMPSSLCNQCGWSCRLVTFKGLTSAEAVQNLAASEGEGAEQARDFLSLFTPYETQAEVKEMAPVFVERVRDVAVSKGLNPDETSFFKCRYLQPDSRCGVYEDRPEGCRRYPLAHPNTIGVSTIVVVVGSSEVACWNKKRPIRLIAALKFSLDVCLSRRTLRLWWTSG